MLLPFTYEESYEAAISMFQVGDVTFVRDFGPWVHGQKCDIIDIDFNKGYIAEYTNDSDVPVKKYSIRLECSDPLPCKKVDNDEFYSGN